MAIVLFVDDEPDLELLISQKFRREIQDGTYQFIFAQNGKEALEAIKKNPNIDVVVSDVNMPEMDGLTLLDNLKTLCPTTKAIVVSAYGDSKTLRAAMNKGAFDFVTKPVDFQDLGKAIQRTIDAGKEEKACLYDYQIALASQFPPRIDLNYSPQEKTHLWDAFQASPKATILMGLHVSSSPYPLEISFGIVHSFVRSNLFENPDLSIEELKELLSKPFPGLNCHLIIGLFQTENSVFTFKTDGPFYVHHLTSRGKTSVSPEQSALLDEGDSILLEEENKISQLTLTRI